MTEPAQEELKQQILEYLKKGKAKSRDIATALNVKKSEVDQVIKELALADKVEFLYLGTSYVTLKGNG